MTSDKKNSKGKTKSVKKVTKNHANSNCPCHWCSFQEHPELIKNENRQAKAEFFVNVLCGPGAAKLRISFESMEGMQGKEKGTIIEKIKGFSCRRCWTEEYAKRRDGMAHGQGGQGSAGIKGMGDNGLRIESQRLDCKKHGNGMHDKWTGKLTNKYQQSDVPKPFQKKFMEIQNCVDVVGGEKLKENQLILDHKFPRRHFKVDEIEKEEYKEILTKMKSEIQKERKEGETKARKYFQLLRKSSKEDSDRDITKNDNKLKDSDCSNCCTCPICEKKYHEHDNEELDKCKKKKRRKTRGSNFGKRGTPLGIKFYYKGNENWDKKYPRNGTAAEKGCEGCGWYDVEKWKKELNKELRKIQTKSKSHK